MVFIVSVEIVFLQKLFIKVLEVFYCFVFGAYEICAVAPDGQKTAR